MDAFYVNGRLLEAPREEILALRTGDLLVSGDQVVAFRVPSGSRIDTPLSYKSLTAQAEFKETKEVRCRLVTFPWELVESVGEIVSSDFQKIKRRAHGSISSSVALRGPEAGLSMGKGSTVEDSILYLDEGPIHIGNDVTIRGYSKIRGPCAIGDGSVIDGAKVTHSSIGPQCRLSGEIEQTIFQGYANKQHEGFLGHSFLGEWVNLGAGTTNSDLKNNYKEVRVRLAGEFRSTGSLKVGCFVGDHTKTGIGALINTGSVFGTFCNLLGGRLCPGYVPAFVWDTGGEYAEYRIDKAIETARLVMERRGVTLTPHLEQAVRHIFASTAQERKDFLRRQAHKSTGLTTQERFIDS